MGEATTRGGRGTGDGVRVVWEDLLGNGPQDRARGIGLDRLLAPAESLPQVAVKAERDIGQKVSALRAEAETLIHLQGGPGIADVYWVGKRDLNGEVRRRTSSLRILRLVELQHPGDGAAGPGHGGSSRAHGQENRKDCLP